jgi:capsular polysaccharide biosynthesis protein
MMRPCDLRSATECGPTLLAVPGGGPYSRVLPRVEGPRPGWMVADLWRKYYETANPPDGRAVLLRDATVLGPGIVMLPGNVLVLESLLNCWDIDRAPGLARDAERRWCATDAPQPPARWQGRFLLLRQMWDENYGHWLIEVLPRLALLRDAEVLASCRALVSGFRAGDPDAPMGEVQDRTLGAYGFGPDRIRTMGWDPVTVPELVFVLPMTAQPWLKAPLVVDLLERLGQGIAAGDQDPGQERLYLRRAPAARRRPTNEAAVEAMLTARGYGVITPGALGFPRQVAAFRSARHVVATLGAECANLVFAPRGVSLLGLAPPEMQDDFFYDLVSLKGGAYACLHGDADAPGMNADFTPDLDRLNAMLPG